MAMSRTYGQMQQQIADELGDRQDLLVPLSDSTETLSPIQLAIQQAIAKWERNRFYFNDIIVKTPLSGPYTFSLVQGQEYYSVSDWAAIPTLVVIRKMWALAYGQRYFLDPRNAEYLDEMSVNQLTQSLVTDYAYAGEQLRFYPIPDNSYPIGIEGTQRLAALALSTDTNAWTQDAFDLIRSEAKLTLAREVLFDPEVAGNAMAAIYGNRVSGERGYLSVLKGETTKRVGRGKIRPSHF